MKEDHDFIYLESLKQNGDYDEHGRVWCADHVWLKSEGEPTKYVRTDLYDDVKAESERLKQELDGVYKELSRVAKELNEAERELFLKS